jgi:hypothetical protein
MNAEEKLYEFDSTNYNIEESEQKDMGEITRRFIGHFIKRTRKR